MNNSKQLLGRGVGRAFDIVMKRGSGSWIWTTDGRKLLDFTSGVCVTNLGHSHPRVVQAAQQQIETLAHGMVLQSLTHMDASSDALARALTVFDVVLTRSLCTHVRVLPNR